MNDKDKIKLFSIDMEVMPKVRLIGHVNYSTPWKHFTRTLELLANMSCIL